jgi:hypothetical protein
MVKVRSETRSRVFWCCYVLDKVMAEETGKPYLISAACTNVALPSTQEADEYEFWPLPSASVTHSTIPRTLARAHVLSVFQQTCRLAVIVEALLSEDWKGPHVDLLANQATGEGDGIQLVLARLDAWWSLLPSILVRESSELAPHMVQLLVVWSCPFTEIAYYSGTTPPVSTVSRSPSTVVYLRRSLLPATSIRLKLRICMTVWSVPAS